MELPSLWGTWVSSEGLQMGVKSPNDSVQKMLSQIDPVDQFLQRFCRGDWTVLTTRSVGIAQ